MLFPRQTPQKGSTGRHRTFGTPRTTLAALSTPAPLQVWVTVETRIPAPRGPGALLQPSTKPVCRAPSPRSQAAVRTAQQGIPTG